MWVIPSVERRERLAGPVPEQSVTQQSATYYPSDTVPSYNLVMHPGSVIDSFPTRLADMSPEMRALELQTFGIAFESALEAAAAGTTLEQFATSYHVRLNAPRFRTWIYQHAKRRNAWQAAKAVGAEQVEEDLIRIADGINPDGTASLADVQRSTLQVNTRRWLLQVWNRERYGDVRKIEQTTTSRIDPSSLSTPELQERLLAALGVEPSDLDADD